MNITEDGDRLKEIRKKTLDKISKVRHEVSAENITLQAAIIKLIGSLDNNKDYRLSWKSNIAMAIYETFTSDPTDCFRGSGLDIAEFDLHELSNLAADRFLEILTN